MWHGALIVTRFDHSVNLEGRGSKCARTVKKVDSCARFLNLSKPEKVYMDTFHTIVNGMALKESQKGLKEKIFTAIVIAGRILRVIIIIKETRTRGN